MFKGIPTLTDLRESRESGDLKGASNHDYVLALSDARAAHLTENMTLMAEAEGRDGGAGLTTREAETFDKRDQHIGLLTREIEMHEVDRRGVVGDGPLQRGATVADKRDAVILDPEKRDAMTSWARRTQSIPAEHEGLDFGNYMRGIVTGRWDGADAERRAMSEGTLTAGGNLVPTLLSSEIVDLARNKTRVIEAGARVVPMANRTVDVPKWTGDQSLAFHAENAAITPSDATIGKVTLTARTLAGIVIVSRELFEDADAANLGGELRNAFAAQLALVIDSNALYGTGAGGSFTGIKSTSGVTVSPIATNGQALANYDPIVNTVFTVKNANEDPTAVIWSPRTAKNAALLKDTTNQPMRVPEYLSGLKLLDTKQVPDNLVVGTSGSTTSDVFAGDFRQLVIGVRTDLEIRPLNERYVENGQIGFSAWWRGDIAVLRGAAFAVTTGVL